MIELITVMIIIGIVASVSVPKLQNLPNTRAQFAIRKLRSDVRYAQLLAMESQARTRVVFDTAADTYELQRESAPNTWVAVTDPASKGNYSVTFNAGDYAGVDITSAVFNAASTVIFNTFGAPFDGSGNVLVEPSQVVLNSGAYQLRFRAQTGKVDIV